MLFFKKEIYSNLIKKKRLHNLHTYNFISLKKHYANLKLKKWYNIYILTQEDVFTKPYIKEISAILIKQNKSQNLTKLHLICLKKYNNIYFSCFKESPNIYFNKI